jgi:SAM-dependent methyltransferase
MADAQQPVVPGFHGERYDSYLAGTEGAPPRDLLMRALQILGPEAPATALDLGCGPGREIPPMVRRGLRVTAVDPYADMLRRSRALLEQTFPASGTASEEPSTGVPQRYPVVEFVQSTLEALAPKLSPRHFGLIHAGFVLPFVRPSRFAPSFAALRESLAPQGLLVAQFFGPDDEFIRGAEPDTMTSHRADELDALLAGLEILHREEVNRAGNIGRGRPKWWHVHHVIARRQA